MPAAEIHQRMQTGIRHDNDAAAMPAVAPAGPPAGTYFPGETLRLRHRLRRPLLRATLSINMCFPFEKRKTYRNPVSSPLRLCFDRMTSLFSIATESFKTRSVHNRKQGVVRTFVHLYRDGFGAALSNEDITGQNRLSVRTLYAQSF